ncbi:MAG: NfeD family protein [Betaproteobacteria bacterium]
MRLVALLSLAILSGALRAAPAPVIVLNVNGVVGPATADYFHRGLKRAEKDGAQLLVLQVDTPGGLDTSMRAIIKDILASPLPVAVFVAPSGARAASAGTYILYASHIAAMAPATNLGAATPVQIGGFGGEPKGKPGKDNSGEERPGDADAGKDAQSKDGQSKDGQSKDGRSKDGQSKAAAEKPKDVPESADTMTRKMTHDAAAYIRALAQLRGRNVEWAERAVKEAVSLPASEAVTMHVADLIAADLADLLAKIDGRTFEIQGRKLTLNTKDATLVRIEPDWRSQLLAVITDPSVAYILMLLGVYGLLFELYNPGLVLPGVVGAICLLVGLYALQTLPINYAGLGLIVVGIGFIVAELFVTSYGALGVGGVIAFVLGSVMLIDTDVPGYSLPWSLIAIFAIASALFFLAVVGMAVRASKRPVVSGREELIGAHGEVIQEADGEWWARVHSETWKVKSAVPLHRGQRIRVNTIDGLVLNVEPESPTR